LTASAKKRKGLREDGWECRRVAGMVEINVGRGTYTRAKKRFLIRVVKSNPNRKISPGGWGGSTKDKTRGKALEV